MNWALRRGLARFYRALFGSRVTLSPGEGGQHSQAGYLFIFLIVINPCLVIIEPNEPAFSALSRGLTTFGGGGWLDEWSNPGTWRTIRAKNCGRCLAGRLPTRGIYRGWRFQGKYLTMKGMKNMKKNFMPFMVFMVY